MKISISIATFLLAGAGIAGIGSINPIESPLQGSDTLFNVTQDALNALTALGSSIGPASTYVGGGSGNGQSALVGGSQHIAPMSRMLNNGASICTKDTGNASGIVIGLDGVDIWGAGEQASNAATCNSAGNGLAYDGVNGQGFTSYKSVLALVYGGLDNTTGKVDCNSTKRNAVVNNWNSLFENSCSNTDAACINAAHGVTAGQPAKLWHAFRRDDASGTSDVFATILGITPNTSASSLNGFGASPYCNALNWDTSTANANCTAGAGKQYIGPGGVPQGFCGGVTTGAACVVGATYCTGTNLRCDPAPAANTCPSPSTCTATVATPDPCAGAACAVASGDSHRRPPLNTWGDDPDPNTNLRGEGDADVLPTSFQDNDPIRRSCIGTSVYTILRDGEEVCNRNGTLGLVLPIAASDFIADLPDPNHAGQNLVQFPMNPCGAFDLGLSVSVLTCAPRNTAKHAGVCPNGDLTFGASHTCEVPVDLINNTSQCQQIKSAGSVGIKQRGDVASSADGRIYNTHLHDGTTVDGSIGYAHETIPTTTATLSLDFAGAFNRIHQVATIPAAGAGHTGGCTQKDSTDQIACLTHADRCSIGYAGDGGGTYSQRYANGTCATGGAQCSINGNPCSYFGATSGGACVVASQFSAVPVASILVNKIAPSATTIQALGNGATEYPLARKLYLNSLNFSQGIDGGFPTGTFASGISEAELTLAKFESTTGTFGLCTAGTCSVGGAACSPNGSQCIAETRPSFDGIGPLLINDGFFTLGSQSPNGGNSNPFCEDFNQALVCADAGTINDNACARNPQFLNIAYTDAGLPGDPSSVPDANTTSTVCGNGVLDPFEECDPALPSTAWTCSVPGATSCSSTCRC